MPDRDLPATFRNWKRHEHIAHQGEEQPAAYLVEEGWACRYHVLANGQRQINALFLPGEYCEPQWLLGPVARRPIIALTALRARPIALAALREEGRSRREWTASFFGAILLTIERQADWMVSLARKSAMERLSALLYDLFVRLQASGRVTNNRCSIPLTQHDFADIAGLTSVHVNRVLKALRAQGLVELDAKQLHVPNLGALRQAAGVPRQARSASGRNSFEEANLADNRESRQESERMM